MGRAGIALEAGEVGAHFGSVLVAQVAIFFEGLVDDAIQLRRRIGVHARYGSGRAVEDRFKNDAGTFSAEGQLAGGHFVENHAEGK